MPGFMGAMVTAWGREYTDKRELALPSAVWDRPVPLGIILVRDSSILPKREICCNTIACMNHIKAKWTIIIINKTKNILINELCAATNRTMNIIKVMQESYYSWLHVTDSHRLRCDFCNPTWGCDEHDRWDAVKQSELLCWRGLSSATPSHLSMPSSTPPHTHTYTVPLVHH